MTFFDPDTLAQIDAGYKKSTTPVAPKKRGGLTGFLDSAIRGIARPFNQLLIEPTVSAAKQTAAELTGNRKAELNARKNTFGGAENAADALKNVAGNTAQVGLTLAVPGSTSIAKNAALGAGFGASSELAEKGSNLEDVIHGAETGGLFGGALGAGGKVLGKFGSKVAEEEAPKAGGVLDNLTTQGQQMQARGLGASGGAKVAGKAELLPQDTEKILNTLKSHEIPIRNANTVARDVQSKLDYYGKQIADHFKTNNGPLYEKDTQKIADNFIDGLSSTDPLLRKKAEVLANDYVKNVKDVKGTWEFRKNLDSRIPDSKFADNATSKEIQAIKEFRGYLSNELGDVPGMSDYNQLSSVKPYLAKGMRELNQPSGGIVGRVLSSGPVQKSESLLGKGLEKVGNLGKNGLPFENKLSEPASGFLGNLVTQSTVRAGSQQGDTTVAPDQQESDLPYGATDIAAPNQPETATQDTNPFGSDSIQKAIIADLGTNGGKNVSTLLKLYETFGQEPSSTQKPLSAEASKTVSNAQTGLKALQDFKTAIAKNPGAFSRTNIPGEGVLDSLTGGRVSRLLGTSDIDAASQQIVDVIARLRTGAAISKAEEARFKKFIPLPGDPESVREQKLGYLEDQFNMVAQRSSGSTELDPSQALAGATF